MPNRLAHETSPYLKQHEHNPVDWYPWGDEAFARARTENKPILLSIGYSACHWCHVMAHESFEDEETAQLMNEKYVSIKVDREEMPDVDQIYQQALQLQGEHGGWPLTMFLLPDGTPFFGGTYFPKRDGFGRPSFKRVLTSLSNAFSTDMPAIESNARQFKEGLAHLAKHGRSEGETKLLPDATDRAATKLAINVDRREGGFGGAPKFPNPKAFELILRAWRRTGDPELLQAVTRTLLKMAAGGIYDQAGGGFARYSTDAVWLVPHFEKMLYDNAQLLTLYAEAYQATGDKTYERICRETHGWIEREMRSPEGGLYTALDADSEGVEGKYYVWNPSEVRALCGDDADEVMRCFDVREGGNWRDPHGHGPENASILHVVAAPQKDLRPALDKLLAARLKRVPPGTDDKMLASINGLAIGGLAEAGRIFGKKELIDSARKTAEFVVDKMLANRLFRSFKNGVAKLPGTLEDHAYVADGLIHLYEATGEGKWLEVAHQLTKLSVELFYDANERAFYMTATDDPGLIQRPLSQYDSAVPSGMSVTLENLVRLGDLGEPSWLEIADSVFQAYFARALENPFGFSNFLNALDLYLERPAEIVIGEKFERAVASVYLPNRIIVRGESPLVKPLLEGKSPELAYVCRNFTCEKPESDPEALIAALRRTGP
jgi:uncharacterized protein YyaL (SSP411 family)